MTSEMIKSLAERILTDQLRPFGVERLSISEGIDQTAQDAIFITAHLLPNSPPVPGSVALGATASISRALLDVGEKRFPFTRFDHSGEEEAEDYFPDLEQAR